MGQTLDRMLAILSRRVEKRVVLLGLDNAGKTTCVYRMLLGKKIDTVPTVGFNSEEVRYNRCNFIMWDIGGQAKIRKLWKHYVESADALIFVVDAQDRSRLREARAAFKKMLRHKTLRNTVLLIYANKTDYDQCMTPAEIVEGLDVKRVIGERKWCIQKTCAISGQGLREGLEWLSKALEVPFRGEDAAAGGVDCESDGAATTTTPRGLENGNGGGGGGSIVPCNVCIPSPWRWVVQRQRSRSRQRALGAGSPSSSSSSSLTRTGAGAGAGTAAGAGAGREGGIIDPRTPEEEATRRRSSGSGGGGEAEALVSGGGGDGGGEEVKSSTSYSADASTSLPYIQHQMHKEHSTGSSGSGRGSGVSHQHHNPQHHSHPHHSPHHPGPGPLPKQRSHSHSHSHSSSHPLPPPLALSPAPASFTSSTTATAMACAQFHS